MNEVRVNRKAAERIEGGHPWIFSSDVTDRRRRAAGRGREGGGRRWPPAGDGASLLGFADRAADAVAAGGGDRPRLLDAAPAARPRNIGARWCGIPMPTAWSTARRDLLPALVVDRYGDYLVMQTLDQGMDAAKQTIVECLQEIFRAQGHRGAQRRGGAGEGAVAARRRR